MDIKRTLFARFILEKWRSRNRTATLTEEEWYELRRSVESDARREMAAIQAHDCYGSDDLKKRAMHSVKVRESVLKKIP